MMTKDDYLKEFELAKVEFEKHQKLHDLLWELYPEPNYYGIEKARMLFDNKRLGAQVRYLNLKILTEKN